MTQFYSRNDVNYSGDVYSIPFDYIDKKEVKVYIDDELWTKWHFLNKHQLTLDEVPEDIRYSNIISVRRETDIEEKVVTYDNNSLLNKENLNKSQDQLLFAVQEIYDNNTQFGIDVDNILVENKAEMDAVIEQNKQEILGIQSQFKEETNATIAKNRQEILTIQSEFEKETNDTLDEYKEITDAKIVEIDRVAKSVVDTANNALATSKEAEQTADSAVSKADSAVSTANSATTTANRAETIANTANETSNQAVTIANTATNTSNQAVETANTALQNSASAVNTANTSSSKVDMFGESIETVLDAADKIFELDESVQTAVNAAELANQAAESATQAAEDAISTLDSKADKTDIKNGKLTIQANGSTVATFTANQEGDSTANIVIPDSAQWGKITGTLSSQTDLQNALNGKANDSTVIHKTGNETIAGDKIFSNTISAEHGKFGKKLTTYRYTPDETPTTTYYWYKIFQSSTSSQCVNFEIMAHSDNNYPQFAKYTISVSNYTNNSTSIVVYNHGKIGATPNIKVAIDADGNVYLQANCIWDCVLTANNVYGNATVPYTNMGYGAFGTPVGFTSIGMITSTGALRYLKKSGTVTYSTPEIDALATKATADASGNTITSTYRKISDSYTKTDVYNKTEVDNIIKANKRLDLFDTILKDYILTYEESKGLALQGTYVYKDAIAGSRYGYPDFYTKCLEEYQNSTNEKAYLKSNVVKVGSVVDNQGVLSGFNASNYATLTNSFYSADAWECQFKVTTGTINTSSEHFIISTNSGATNNYSFLCGSSMGKWKLFLSSNGSSWDINNATAGSDVLSNTTYWIRCGWTKSEYYLEYSLNGTDFIRDITIASTVPVYTDTSKPVLGNCWNTAYWSGSIDLNECYININGSRWWNGVDNLEYKKNPNGHIFYDISQKDQIDELFNSTDMAWFYGVDTENERIFLPRDNKKIHGELIERNESGTDWYRIYSDGWCEQGFRVAAQEQNIKKAYNLLKPMINTNYSAMFTENSGTSGCHQTKLYATSTTQVTVATPSGGGMKGGFVEVRGYTTIEQPIEAEKYTYICVGNTESKSSVTNVIDITTTENDTIPLGYSTYQNGTQPSISWLKSAGQWNDGNVYTTFYNEFVNKLGQDFASGKVVNHTETFTDYDLVINQDDMSFRLPLLDGSESLPSEKYIELPIKESGAEYVAPANGTVYVSGDTKSQNTANNIYIYSSTGNARSFCEEIAVTMKVDLPVSKGATFTVGYNNVTLTSVNFHYFKGNGSLYFKVANSVQNLELLDAGEVLEAVNQINDNSIQKNNQSDIDITMGWMSPNTNIEISLTNGSSSSPYNFPYPVMFTSTQANIAADSELHISKVPNGNSYATILMGYSGSGRRQSFSWIIGANYNFYITNANVSKAYPLLGGNY